MGPCQLGKTLLTSVCLCLCKYVDLVVMRGVLPLEDTLDAIEMVVRCLCLHVFTGAGRDESDQLLDELLECLTAILIDVPVV